MNEPVTSHLPIDGFRVLANKNGNVDFAFTSGTTDLIKGQLTPEQVADFASGLLDCQFFAFHDAGKTANPSVREAPIKKLVHTTQWFLGRTNVAGQKAIGVQAGESVIGFAVDEAQMRSMGRMLIHTSWRSFPVAGTPALLGSIFRDFFEDIYGWCYLTTRRAKIVWRRRLALAREILRGRSFRQFRLVKFVPNMGIVEYPPVKECIYCGSKVYSERTGDRREPLGGEHIVAEGLDATLELPEASCRKCEDATGRLVEGDVLGITMKALRVHLKIKGKGKKPPPTTLPLMRSDVKPEQTIQIPIEDYPIAMLMPVYGAPPFFSGGPGGNQTTAGFRWVALQFDQSKLRRKYGITSFSSPRWDTLMLFRMLAKIGHAFAAAEIPGKFRPLLTDLIRFGNVSLLNHIGGDPDLAYNPKSESLHEIALGYQRALGKDFILAKIRLFAKLGGPIYYVVVGESLEGPIAKFSRVFSSKISSMLRR